MRSRQALMLGAAAVVVAAFFVGAPSRPHAQTPVVAIDNDDIGGVVTGPKGPGGGVWVIAETTDLPTKYAKIVVTDDQGRYVLPDLPEGEVQGVGARLRTDRLRQGRRRARPPLNLSAVVAPNEKAAAEYYPPIYWYSMLRIPAKTNSPAPVRRATASIPVSAASITGSPTSNRSAASRVTRSARRARARSRASSVTSPTRATPGCAASRPDRRWGRWSAW